MHFKWTICANSHFKKVSSLAYSCHDPLLTVLEKAGIKHTTQTPQAA